jgi:uncharacterized membrane protein
MNAFIAGLLLFFGTHSISIVAGPARDRLVARMGANAWRGLYSLLAIAGFVLLLKGYGELRQAGTLLYAPPAWMHHVTATLMLPVFPLLLAAYLPGRIRTAARHPMLAATKLWAFAHLLSNGSLADVLLFGSFLAWAVADRISLKRRVQRPISTLPSAPWNDAIAVIGGLAMYAAFVLQLHRLLIGVSPV